MMKKMNALMGLMLCSVIGLSHAYEDADTAGQGKVELELATERASNDSGDTVNWETMATVTYGLAEALDISVTVPHLVNKADGVDTESGLGDMALGLKWRFLDADALKMALAAEITAPTGDDDKGLGAGRANYGAMLIAAYELGDVTLFANAGYRYNDNRADERKQIWQTAVAAEYKFSEQWAVNTELAQERNADRSVSRNPAIWGVGFTFTPSDLLDIDVGYQHGLNDEADDHVVSAGLTFHF
jgi:hypothetical protein